MKRKVHFDELKKRIARAHGNGLNFEFVWKEHAKSFELSTFYHYMNDAGYYTDVLPVHVWFPKKDVFQFKVRCRNINELRYYIEDLIFYALGD